eukprot:6730452-Karenia_brevis.AAC.1
MCQVRVSLTDFPVYLGPSWDPRTKAANIMATFLKQQGGSVRVEDLRVLYDDYPGLKPALGPLQAFCKRHRSFVFQRRSPGNCALISLRALSASHLLAMSAGKGCRTEGLHTSAQ